jgi:hypothetical protein
MKPAVSLLLLGLAGFIIAVTIFAVGVILSAYTLTHP